MNGLDFLAKCKSSSPIWKQKSDGLLRVEVQDGPRAYSYKHVWLYNLHKQVTGSISPLRVMGPYKQKTGDWGPPLWNGHGSMAFSNIR